MNPDSQEFTDSDPLALDDCRVTEDNGVLMLAEKTVMVPLRHLKRDLNKVKTHPPGQIAKLAAMMVEFGWTVPCMIDGDYNIIAGDGRYLAALSLNLSRVPCVPVTQLTPTQVRALILADNKINESAWNFEEVKTNLSELKIADEELLAMTGFDFDEIDEILDGFLTDECDDGEDADVPKMHFLTVGKHRVNLEIAERDQLVEMFSRWSKKEGSYAGMVKHLIHCVECYDDPSKLGDNGLDLPPAQTRTEY